MRRFTPTRFIPEGATARPHPDGEALAVVYTYQKGEKLCAIGYVGKQSKPLGHYSYRFEAQREAWIQRLFENVSARHAYKRAQHEARKAKGPEPGTTTGEAARIREAYKAKGWGPRMVGVRSEYYSMGSSIHIEIKSPEVDETEAKRIAESAERIHRCEYSGEILSGGNRYVSVNYSRECQAILARRHVDALTKAVDALVPEDPARHRPVEIPGRPAFDVSVSFEGSRAGGWAQLWIGGRAGLTFPRSPEGIEGGAFALARALARGIES